MEPAMSTDLKDDAAKAADTRKTGFGPKGSPGDKHLDENTKERLDERLDEAVDETFPGSDPVSVKITK